MSSSRHISPLAYRHFYADTNGRTMFQPHSALRRTTLSISLALALGAGLMACGGNNTPGTTADPVASARMVSIVAATGKALAGSVVNVYDATQTKVGFSATDASGKINVAISATAK